MSKPSASSVIPTFIIISIIIGGLYFLFKPQDDAIRQVDTSRLTSNSRQPTNSKKIQEETPDTKDNQSDISHYRRAPMEATISDPCLDTIKQLDSFFLYLDTQDYIKEYQFPNGSKDFVASMTNKALSHPPVFSMNQSISSQAKTGAYLYRTIGGQNLLILAKILISEPDHLENIFETFYTWSLMAGQCQNRTYAIRPQLDQLYQYAIFFIDSLDGKNYVNRRESTTGLLTRFYSLQIIKEAQVNHIDKYNTNLAPHILSLITDIESTDLLEKKTTYLKQLYSLRDK